MAEEFIAPDIYNSTDYQKFVNSKFASLDPMSDFNIATSFWESELGGFDSRTSDAFVSFQNAIKALPNNLKKEGVLSQIDLRPLLLAYKEYLQRDDAIIPAGVYKTRYIANFDKTIKALDTKYREDAKTYVSAQGGGTDVEMESKIDQVLKNTTGYSPLKIVTDDGMGVVTPGVDSGVDSSMSAEGQGPIPEGQPGYQPYTGTTPATPGASINADGTFTANTTDLTGGTQIDYTEWLQEHAMATIDDLLNLEDQTGMAPANVFKAGEFITNLTGQVNAVNWKNPNGGQTTWSLAQGMRYIYGLDTSKVTKLQKSLRDAGYFDKLGKFPAYGKPDEPTALAWNLFLSDSLRNNETPAGRLKKSSEEFAKRMASGQGNLFLDEASVESAVLAVGSQVLGRGLDKTELESLTAVVRNWEREAYKTSATGVGPEGDLFSQPDIEARINRYMQDTYREETVINSMPNNIKLLKQAFG